MLTIQILIDAIEKATVEMSLLNESVSFTAINPSRLIKELKQVMEREDRMKEQMRKLKKLDDTAKHHCEHCFCQKSIITPC